MKDVILYVELKSDIWGKDLELELRSFFYSKDKDSFDFFECGDNGIDEYIRQNAISDFMNHKISLRILKEKDTLIGIIIYEYKSISYKDCENREIYFPFYHIKYIAVLKKLQNQGIGSEIMQLLLEELFKVNESLNYRGLSLFSLPIVKEFYKKLGFEEINGFKVDGREGKHMLMLRDFSDLETYREYCRDGEI